jgi:hypothetical protein
MASPLRQFRDKLLPGAVIAITDDVLIYVNSKSRLHLIKKSKGKPSHGNWSTFGGYSLPGPSTLMVLRVYRRAQDPNGHVHDHIKIPVKHANNSAFLDLMLDERVVCLHVDNLINVFHNGCAEIM